MTIACQQESATANTQVIAEKDMLQVQAIHTWQTKKPAYHQCGRQILKAGHKKRSCFCS